jgi:hypothetical protein
MNLFLHHPKAKRGISNAWNEQGVAFAYPKNEGGEARGAESVRRATFPPYLRQTFSTLSVEIILFEASFYADNNRNSAF